ncbi:hypothetical protein BC351_01220 [Paenibacillus ferrarius]|uniref:Uncharacterized protein n=1 Tax=Paenibacillus ferrarius TaxID=1469647 RepID=A0A1V4HSI1_9BACL|nr:hypothetical protein [Paenibacillus ferrarius]OPH61891.1 hypothetical protein BC351_01220 [Paenibacillus ferrarius]
MSNEKKEYWINRIYEEILTGNEELYDDFSFDFKNIETSPTSLIVDVQLRFGSKTTNQDDAMKTLNKVGKLLELLLTK